MMLHVWTAGRYKGKLSLRVTDLDSNTQPVTDEAAIPEIGLSDISLDEELQLTVGYVNATTFTDSSNW